MAEGSRRVRRSVRPTDTKGHYDASVAPLSCLQLLIANLPLSRLLPVLLPTAYLIRKSNGISSIDSPLFIRSSNAM